MKNSLQKHLEKILHWRIQKAGKKLPFAMRKFFRMVFFRPSLILFYPQNPETNRYGYSIIKICKNLGYEITQNTEGKFHLVIRWEDQTFGKIDSKLKNIAKNNYVINLNCHNISKKNVDSVFQSVFKYSLLVDPYTYKGPIVEKSNFNGRHDGKIVKGPLSKINEDCVYQKLLDNKYDEKYVFDIRIPFFKNIIPFVYFKFKEIDNRFSVSVKGIVEKVEKVFSPEEIEKILLFCETMGFDFGELDVIRDKTDNKIYIIDVNNTPTLHLAGFTDQQKKWIIKRMSHSFDKAFSGSLLIRRQTII